MESATRETVSRDGRVAASLETTKTAEAGMLSVLSYRIASSADQP